MSSHPYNLVIATGQTPQVITETVFELYRAEQLQPAAVHVVTTRVGRAYGEAQLLGRDRMDPARGVAIEGVADRWRQFCHEVLGRSSDGEALPVDLSFHVPTVDAEGLEDIRRKGDDTRFANLCYELVEAHTQDGLIPLVGSIAGGRKTMSAHLMTALSVYGRPDDRLTHVLLSDPSLEGDPSFFYPERGNPRYGQLLDLVNIRFPRLRTLLDSDLIDGLPEDRRDLEGILDALDPHVASARTVEEVTLRLQDGGAHLIFEGAEDTLDTCRLSPKQAGTLLVFAEHRAANGAPVPSTDLTYQTSSEPVGRQRQAVQFLCSRGETLDPWADTEQSSATTKVSKALSDLNDALKEVPIAERLFEVEGLSRSPRRYDWPGELPRLRVATRYPDENWPFEHVPDLERMEQSA